MTKSGTDVTASTTTTVDRATESRRRPASRLLAELVRPHRRPIAFAGLLLVAENMVRLASPLIVATAIDTGVPAALAGDPWLLLLAVVAYPVCGLFAAGLLAAFLRVSGRCGQAILLELRRRIFRHSQELSLDFHESYTAGGIISRLTSDLDALHDLLERGLDGAIGGMLSLAGATVLLCWLDLRLAAIVFAGFLPLLLLFRWFRSRSLASHRRTRLSAAKVIGHAVESITGIRAVQAFRREGRNEATMNELSTAQQEASADALRTIAWFTSGVRGVGNATLSLVLLAGGILVGQGDLALGTLTAFMMYLRHLYDPLESLSQFFNSYQSAAAGLEQIVRLLDQRPDVPEPVRPIPLPKPVQGDIRLVNVQFAYPRARERTVLAGFSLHVPAGQTVAVVGATGAGKSTLAKLIARFYDPLAGAVLLDGVDLRNVAAADLRRALVMIPQEPFLFSGTVADNIAMGRPEARRPEIEAAAIAVGATGFIAQLPKGFDTEVGRHGNRLSVGQRQLVALARVVLADPAIVLLDEATSSLDLPAERAVQSAQRTVLAGRTSMIIAHRMSTVLVADRVLVLTDGRITQDGPLSELLSVPGPFAELHAIWRASLA